MVKETRTGMRKTGMLRLKMTQFAHTTLSTKYIILTNQFSSTFKASPRLRSESSGPDRRLSLLEVSMKLSKTVTMDHIFIKNVFEIDFIEKT